MYEGEYIPGRAIVTGETGLKFHSEQENISGKKGRQKTEKTAELLPVGHRLGGREGE